MNTIPRIKDKMSKCSLKALNKNHKPDRKYIAYATIVIFSSLIYTPQN